MSTVEVLTKIAGDMGLTATEAVDLAQEALPQARLEAKVIEAAEDVMRYLTRTFDDTVPGPINIWTDKLQVALDALREGE